MMSKDVNNKNRGKKSRKVIKCSVRRRYDRSPVDRISLLLRQITLFSSLPDAEFREIAENILVRQFRKSNVILHEEMTNEVMYIILDGEVKVVRSTEGGREIIVSMHSSGEFFGELSLVDGKTTPATVIATKESIMAIITKRQFYSLIFKHRKVMENFLHILCTRIRESITRIELLNFNNAAQRIKMLLMIMAENYGEQSPAGTILNVRLLHQDIADMVGLSRETVTRVLDRWKKSGEIEILNKKNIRLNPEFNSIPIS